MCEVVSSATKCLQDACIHACSTFEMAVGQSTSWIGRTIHRFRNETIPALIQEVSAISKDTLTNLFWVVPYIALVSGHYIDAAVSTTVACVSGLDLMLDDEEASRTLAIFVAGPIAVNIAVRTIRLLTTGNSFHVISLLFHFVCLAKLAIIAKGQNK
jgi:hypothetical protein